MKNYPLYIGLSIMSLIAIIVIVGANIFFIYSAIHEQSFSLGILALMVIGFELVMLGLSIEDHRMRKDMQESDDRMNGLRHIIKKHNLK